MNNDTNISVIRVADIETLIKTICNIKDPFTKDDFKLYLSNNKKDITDFTVKDYFDFLNKYKFIKRKLNQYELAEITKYIICPNYKKNGFDDQVKKIFYNILYSKEHLFRKLMEKLNIRTKKEDINFVNEHTLNTLLSWGIDLGAIEKTYDGFYYKIKYTEINNISNDEFWVNLIKGYKILTEKDLYEIGDVFVKIPILRNLTSSLMGIHPEQFDILLNRILNDDKYILNIEFSGTTIIYAFDDFKKNEKPFIKNGNRYYFIALNITNLEK